MSRVRCTWPADLGHRTCSLVRCTGFPSSAPWLTAIFRRTKENWNRSKHLQSVSRTTLLVDTCDTLDGVRRVIELHRRLKDGFRVKAIRLDSRDLGDLAFEARRMLDE